MNNITSDISHSLLRGITLLDIFSQGKSELSASEIYLTAKIPRTTAYRMLRTLTEEAWLERSAITGKYSIGPRLYALGNLYTKSTDLVHASEEVIKVVNGLTREAVNIDILQKDNIIIILREESTHSIRWSVHVGSVLPAHATAGGKALLSALSDAELDKVYPEERLQKFTENTIITKSGLKEELERIRRTGVAISVEEAREGICGIASLISNIQGKGIAAMSVSSPLFRLTEPKRESFCEIVKVASCLISHRLGHFKNKYSIRTVEELHYWWEHRGKRKINGKLMV